MTDRRLYRTLNAIVLLLVLLTGGVFGLVAAIGPTALLAAGLCTVILGAIAIPYAMTSASVSADAEPNVE